MPISRRPRCRCLLSDGIGPTFNSVTVDSDTSTSDTLMLFATGAAGADGQATITDAADPALADFRAALNDLLRDLALQVVRDGEGARKMVEVTVDGCGNRCGCQAYRPVDRQFAAGQDGCCR